MKEKLYVIDEANMEKFIMAVANIRISQTMAAPPRQEATRALFEVQRSASQAVIEAAKWK